MQSGAQDAVASVSHAQKEADNTTDHIEKSAISLGEIAGAIQTVNDMGSQIATAAEQQSSVVNEIDRSVINIDELVSKAHDSSTEMSQVSEKLTSVVYDLCRILHQFNKK